MSYYIKTLNSNESGQLITKENGSVQQSINVNVIYREILEIHDVFILTTNYLFLRMLEPFWAEIYNDTTNLKIVKIYCRYIFIYNIYFY